MTVFDKSHHLAADGASVNCQKLAKPLCKVAKKSISKNLTNKTFANIIAGVAKGNRGKPRIIAVLKAVINHLRQTKKITNAHFKENFYVQKIALRSNGNT